MDAIIFSALAITRNFHQYNAPAHRTNVTQQFLRENNFEVIYHAPYSPYLALSDLGLSLTMKTLSVAAHSPAVLLLLPRFSILLKKPSLLPWNHGVDVKNVYVCRAITSRINASFIVFG
ncbi:hypothetical protein C0J52_21560 [Blattella germanica]|nr:hypothetical protein C0J52_21560 [Blattella germanica]